MTTADSPRRAGVFRVDTVALNPEPLPPRITVWAISAVRSQRLV